MRSVYLNETSPSYFGMNTTLFNQAQFWARADAGGEGGVIFDSSVALLQGLFPPTVCHILFTLNVASNPLP